MKFRFQRRHARWVLFAQLLFVAPLALVYQNCSGGGFAAETLDADYTRQLRLSQTTCSLKSETGSETRGVGATETRFTKDSVNFPETCQKVTRTCLETGEWDEPVPDFKTCQQKCLNPTTAALEVCPTKITPPKAVTALPIWRKNMKLWEWKKIDGSDLSTVSPSITVPGALSARVDAFSGLAADTVTNKLYSAANGGGTDYSGNEVYEIDLSSDTPKWRVLREPTPNDLIIAGDASKDLFNDYYKDNRPASSHSYYSLQFISAKQSIFRFGAGATWGTGNEGNLKTDAYSVPYNDWFAPKTYPDISTDKGSTKAVSICKNPLTEEVYINLDRIRKFNPSSGSYTALAAPLAGNDSSDDSNGGCAVDTKRKKILFFKNNKSADGGLLYDIQTDSIQAVAFSGPALRDVRDATAGYGYYDPTFDIYMFKDQKSGNIYRINPDTFESHQVITSGGDSIPDAANGVYTRFIQLPNLKGYAFYPKSGSEIWFLATE